MRLQDGIMIYIKRNEQGQIEELSTTNNGGDYVFVPIVGYPPVLQVPLSKEPVVDKQTE